MTCRDTRASIVFDAQTRLMARVLCHDYGISLAQLLRQLVRAHYYAHYPEPPSSSVPPRRRDHPLGVAALDGSLENKPDE